MIIKNPKPLVSALLAVVFVILCCVGCTFTGANSNSDSNINNEIPEDLYHLRNPYIGDASGNGKLLAALGITKDVGQFTMELETTEEPYVLRLLFDDPVENPEWLNNEMNNYSLLLLALIDNASIIQWKYTVVDKSGAVGEPVIESFSVDDAKMLLSGDNVKDYGKTKAKVEELLQIVEANKAKVEYTLLKIGKDGETINMRESLTEEEFQLAEDLIMNYALQSTLWNGEVPKGKSPYYVIQQSFEGTDQVTNFCVYMTESGGPALQREDENLYAYISPELYEKLAANLDDN